MIWQSMIFGAGITGSRCTKLLGGYQKDLETDLTISINEPAEMREDALAAIGQGFHALKKLKVGIDADLDIKRVKAIREAVGPDIRLRLDANQGWTADEAVRTIRRFGTWAWISNSWNSR